MEPRIELKIKVLEDSQVTIAWERIDGAEEYRIYWADQDTSTVNYRLVGESTDTEFTLKKATHVPHYLKAVAVAGGEEFAVSPVLSTPVKKVFHPQLEKLNRGLQAVKVKNGVFLSWRMFVDEVSGYNNTGMTGTDYVVYKDGKKLALVTDSTNYVDPEGTEKNSYSIAPMTDGKEGIPCEAVKTWDRPYLDIPLQKPADGITPAGIYLQC